MADGGHAGDMPHLLADELAEQLICEGAKYLRVRLLPYILKLGDKLELSGELLHLIVRAAGIRLTTSSPCFANGSFGRGEGSTTADGGPFGWCWLWWRLDRRGEGSHVARDDRQVRAVGE